MAEQVFLGGLPLRGDEYLRPREARLLLGVGERTLRNWANDGVIACVRGPGGQRKYRASDVIALRAARKRQRR